MNPVHRSTWCTPLQALAVEPMQPVEPPKPLQPGDGGPWSPMLWLLRAAHSTPLLEPRLEQGPQ